MESNEFFLQAIRDNGHSLEYIKNLLPCKEVSVNFANPLNQQTALHIAARRGDVELIKLLVSFGAHINSGTVDLMTPLHEACLGGHPEVVDVLIAEGADVCIIHRCMSAYLLYCHEFVKVPTTQSINLRDLKKSLNIKGVPYSQEKKLVAKNKQW